MVDSRKRKRVSPFWIGAAVYGVAALALIGIGLSYFWSFLSAYEASRPRNTVNGYMETLNAQHVLDLAGQELLSRVDGRLRDEEACRAQVLAALQGEFTCAKNISQSTEDVPVYALRLGSRVVGSFRMEQVGEPSWGFTPWEVTGEEFDLSFLLKEGVSVTAPEDYTVLVNGVPLTRDCVAEEIPYPELAEFSDSYTLPTMVRYEVGPLLGEAQVVMTDRDGVPVATETDTKAFLSNCSDGEKERLERTIRTFVAAYVNYTTRNEEDLTASLQALKRLMIPQGALAKRMQGAISSLSWITMDQTAAVTALEIDLISRLADDLYFCDVTYTVDIKNSIRQYQTVSRAKILFRQTDSGLLAETMIII